MKILTLNTWLLPIFSRDKKKRLERISDYIKRRNPDIAALQEVWLSSDIRFLKSQLKYYFYHGNSFFNKSGLLILAKEKAEMSLDFFPLEKSNTVERVAQKGLMTLKFGSFNLVNTHLYYSEKDKHIILRQLEYLKAQVKSPSLVCGDLNLDISDFDKANKGFFEKIDTVKNTYSSSNPYGRVYFNKSGSKDVKKDYILSRKLSCRLESCSKVDEGLSDHYGILASIIFL